MRRDILWRLSLADVCQLEYTDFAEDLRVDIAAYWKSTLEIFWWPNDDIDKYSRLSGMTSTTLGRHCSVNLPLVLLGLFTMRNLLPYQREDDEYISQQYISRISPRTITSCLPRIRIHSDVHFTLLKLFCTLRYFGIYMCF